LKIAFVDEDLSRRTGSRRFTFEVARELGKRGHDVSVFTTRLDRNTCFGAYLSLPVQVFPRKRFVAEQYLRRFVHHHRDNSLVKAGNDLNHSLSQANLIMQMSKKIADLDCDVEMAHYHGEHWLMPYFYYLSRAAGVAYLNVTQPLPRSRALPFQELPIHRRIVSKALLFPLGRWEPESFKKIGLFIGPSRYLLKQAEEQGMLRNRKAEVVPLGVNHSEFCPTGEEEPFALYVGRIHPHKSLELAVMAMKGTNSDASLVIAGDVPDGYQWYKEKLLDLAKKMKVSNKVRIVESPSDLEIVRLMQKCAVFLFPSTIDTFGLVVLEAMACGKPVVACNSGGVPEVIGDAGLLIEPDFLQWQEAVSRLLSDPELRREMGQRSLTRSMLFSWKRTTERLLDAFAGMKITGSD
jgi:glycosyltransferase involved in cell wall biosynthesis